MTVYGDNTWQNGSPYFLRKIRKNGQIRSVYDTDTIRCVFLSQIIRSITDRKRTVLKLYTVVNPPFLHIYGPFSDSKRCRFDRPGNSIRISTDFKRNGNQATLKMEVRRISLNQKR
jgi:hypothetical protein